MNFKKWVKSIQTAGYNGALMVSVTMGQDSPFVFYPNYIFFTTYMTLLCTPQKPRYFNSLGSPVEVLNMRRDLLQWDHDLHLFFPQYIFSHPT